MRDTVRELRGDEQAWVYSFDTGIVFVLAAGAIGIAKFPHSELCVVTEAPCMEELELLKRFDEWEDELGVEHLGERRLIPVRDLVGPPSGAPASDPGVA